MDIVTGLISLSFIVLFFKLVLRRTNKQRKTQPPSPPWVPIVGHLYLLRSPFHRGAHRLSQAYGPVVGLRFGSRRVVVVSSSEVAEECFTKNDVALANRPPFLLNRHVGYGHTTMSTAPYGDHWRNLRRIAAIDIFSAARLKTFAAMRRDEILRLLSKLLSSAAFPPQRVEMKSILSEMTFNVIFRMVAGDGVLDDPREAAQLRSIIKEATASSGAANMADFLPLLNWFNGYERKVARLARMYDHFFQGLIDRFRTNKDMNNKSTMIDHLLSLQRSQPDYYTDTLIKGLVLVLLQAGTDTTSVTLEWAMSNLLNHKEVLKKAKEEIEAKVGSERLVEESDLPRLEYVQSVINETMRLNPGAPLLVPHFSSEEVSVGGYDVPHDTILLVNAWSIHRDPALWGSDAGVFRPERFQGEMSLPAINYRLMPFGQGRRACPGAGLAQRVVGLGLASMIQCFEWERVGEELVDMREGGGVTMPKVVPLEAICKPRPGFARLIRLALV